MTADGQPPVGDEQAIIVFLRQLDHALERVFGSHADRCPVARTIGNCVALSTSFELHTPDRPLS
jgi:hypothetical protein